MIDRKNYRACLGYIDRYWKKLVFHAPKDSGTRVGLPHPAVQPSADFFNGDAFYWDSYFIILGLVVSGRTALAKGIVENFLHLHKRFGLIPLRNRFYNVGVSQPPFLTSMIFEVYYTTRDKSWLRKAMTVAEAEYREYWTEAQKHFSHLAHAGLSRYVDHHITHLAAENESGWDMTSRFSMKCLNYLPVDLNSCLYKYEIDLAEANRILGNKKKEIYFRRCAARRKKMMTRLMWSKSKGFFFDYDYVARAQGGFWSLAGFYPMWAGLATEAQARVLVSRLKRFECAGGLANTQKTGLLKEFRQWDYPNGWPNQQWVVIKGLLQYGYRADAERLAQKWLDMNKRVFERTGKFWEKYDVAARDVGRKDRYPTQHGFGWTNGVFVRLVDELSGSEARQ